MWEKFKGRLAGLAFRMIALLTLGQISPILGACVILEQDGKVLLVERADQLGFTIPGGIVRYNETVEQCVLREVHEETGYRIRLCGLQGVYSAPKRDPRFRSVALVYSGTIVDGELRASTEGRPRWCLPAEVSGRLAFDCDAMLKDYLQGSHCLS